MAAAIIAIALPNPALSDFWSDLGKQIEQDFKKDMRNSFTGNNTPQKSSNANSMAEYNRKKKEELNKILYPEETSVSKSEVRKLQRCLNGLSKYTGTPGAGPADGVLGQKTRDSFNAYYRHYNALGEPAINSKSIQNSCNMLASVEKKKKRQQTQEKKEIAAGWESLGRVKFGRGSSAGIAIKETSCGETVRWKPSISSRDFPRRTDYSGNAYTEKTTTLYISYNCKNGRKETVSPKTIYKGVNRKFTNKCVCRKNGGYDSLNVSIR